MNRGFAAAVVAAMLLGVGLGLVLNAYLPPQAVKSWVDGLSIITDLFLRLIKMIIAPLVFATLVAGIAHMEDAASVGRVGLKTMIWFVSASLVSLLLGLMFVHLFRPGAGLHLAIPAGESKAAVDATGFTFRNFLTHLVPRSVVEAMANNEILQIVVFALFFGTAVSAMRDRVPLVAAFADQVSAVMLKVTGYVMLAAPFAIFAALASTVASEGARVLVNYAEFVGGFYVALGVLWLLLFAVANLAMGRRAVALFAALRTPTLLAFSTASSEVAFPRLLEVLPEAGIARRIVAFVLPLGYSFNLDGSMMYCTFATLFIAQAYGITLGLGQQVAMLLLLMVTSKGMAGVPRASLVVIAATLSYLHLPYEGVTLVLAVDHLLDMGRSATNVIGNSVASAVVARWEGMLESA